MLSASLVATVMQTRLLPPRQELSLLALFQTTYVMLGWSSVLLAFSIYFVDICPYKRAIFNKITMCTQINLQSIGQVTHGHVSWYSFSKVNGLPYDIYIIVTCIVSQQHNNMTLHEPDFFTGSITWHQSPTTTTGAIWLTSLPDPNPSCFSLLLVNVAIHLGIHLSTECSQLHCTCNTLE